MEIKGAADKLATMMNIVRSLKPTCFLSARQPRCSSTPVAASQTYYLPDVHAGKVCPPFHVNCVRTVAAGMRSILLRRYLHMLSVVSRSGWLKHFRSTYARSLDEQSLWLLLETECLLYATLLVSSNSF